MLRLLTYTLLALAVSFALSYYSSQMHPALWRALVTTLFTMVFWWGMAVMAKWLDGLKQKYRV